MADLGVGGACARVVASLWVVSRYVVTGPPGLLIVAVLLVGLSASVCGGSGSGVTAEEQTAARYDGGLELQRQATSSEDYERALADYNQAVRSDPESAEAYAGRAVAYTLLNMDAEADLDVKTAVELGFDPTLLGQIIESLKR